MNKTIRLALAALIACLCGSMTSAQTTRLDQGSLVASSRVIVTGRVVDMESRWDSIHQTIFTYITIDISEVLKGDVRSHSLVIRQQGGRVGDREVWTIGSPVFRIGEEVLLYLNPSADGVLRTAHLGLGKVSLSDSEELARRAQGARPAQYIASVKRLLSGHKGIESDYKVRPDGFVAGIGEHLEEFNLSDGRFFQPDSDQRVDFSVNQDRAPVSGGGVAQTNAAMTAWNNAGTRLRLNNAGSTTACGAVTDGLSTISFGDCLKQIDDPVDGQGQLVAITIVQGKDTRVINGKSFKQTLEADIVFANGLDSVLQASNNLEELIARSLGLAFGLGFSSTDENEQDPVLRQALMYFQPFFDGRGARLNTDDLNAVAKLYPFFAPVSIATTNLAAPILNVDYKQQFQAVDGFPSYRFAVTSGSLPQGLTLSNTGELSGKPLKIETQTFTVTVTDSANFTASKSFTLAVTAISPLIFTVSPTRLCNNANTKLTITGTAFSGVTAVTISSGTVTSFRIIDDKTLEVNVKGPGRPGATADLTVTNPGGSDTLKSAFVYSGPFITSATIGKVQVRNDKGNLVNKRGITVFGPGIGFNQILVIDGKQATDLKVNRFSTEEYVFYGTLSGLVPAKGDFDIQLIEPALNNCTSNTFKIRRDK